MKAFFLTVLALSSLAAQASTIDRVTAISVDQSGQHAVIQAVPYPDPQAGYKEVVIRPGYDPKNLDANRDKKIEVVFSKPATVDACNYESYMGKLEKKEVPNWEFLDYYELTAGDIMTTLMGCGDQSTHVALIPVSTQQGLFDFTDALVLHVPSDVTVQYRVWSPNAFTPAN